METQTFYLSQMALRKDRNNTEMNVLEGMDSPPREGMRPGLHLERMARKDPPELGTFTHGESNMSICPSYINCTLLFLEARFT